MPVEPIPCDDGGSTPVEVTTCCSPSIASAPLCRADGSTVLLVIRSGCVECGEAATDPTAVGWIDPASGTYTEGNAPADAGPCSTGCCSPSITSATLCRDDGASVLIVVRSACVDCADDATDPVVVGWFDLATGVFTAGPAPDGTGQCETGCIDTVCRQLCDDTDGDGAADATYSELWCVRADGTAELVLTYQNDPSAPYAPVAPVECVYGSQESETFPLCDTAPDGTVTPFLRRYTFLDGTASFEDFTLDGQTPHVVTGTVGICAQTSDCEEPTTPTATVGLCMPDGTPLAVVVTRDCTGTVTQDGWINLTTGTYSAGAPPVGAAACGGSRAFELAGLLCDINPATDDVLGLVLVEYSYAADGSLDSVRLVDPATGATYTLQGELRNCPGDGAAQPDADLIVLCDTAPDGTVVPFLRDYRRDATNTVTGHTDYSLGGAPYTAAGTVGICQPATPDDECRDTSSTLLCDVSALTTITVFDPLNRPDSDGWEITSYTDGGCATVNPPDGPVPGPAVWSSPAWLAVRADRDLGTGCTAWAGYHTATVRWVLTKTFAAPQDGMAVITADGLIADGGVRVRVNGTDVGLYAQFNQPATGGSAQVPVMSGPNVIELEVRDIGGPNAVGGRLDIVMMDTVQFFRKTVTDCATGAVVSITDTTLDGQPYTVTGEVGQCDPVVECCEQRPPEARRDVETQLLCVRDETTGQILGQIIAERTYDDQTGDLVEQRLSDLAGGLFTLPAGTELAKCPSPDRITRQVCVVESGTSEFLTNAANATAGQDTDWTWAPTLTGIWHPMYRVAPNPVWTATDTAPNQAHWVSPHSNRTVCPAAGETSPPVPGTWYTRASWNLPVDVEPESIRIAATVLNADNKVVQWRLNDGSWQPVAGGTLANPPWTFPPTAVPGGRAGQNEVVVQLLETQPAVSCPSPNEAGMLLHVIATYDHAPKVWTQVIEPGGQTYYLDENGDRQDAIPAGLRLVPCGGGGEAPCCPAVNVETVTLCDTAPDGTVTAFLRHLAYTEGATVPAVTDTELDGVTAYAPAGTVGICTASPEDCRNSSTLLLCDLPTDGEPDPAVTDAPPGPYYPYPTGAAVAGAQVLWDGGTLTIPAANAPRPGTVGAVATLAATVQAPLPACGAGTARVTVSVTAQQTGPDAGCAATGYLRLFNTAAAPIALALTPGNTPAGWSGTLTVEADVPAADLASGNIAALLALDTYDDSPAACPGGPRETGWQLSAFTATIRYDQTGCATQFLRTVTVDCETGAVVATSDTTLDGAPYTVTGEPGRCTPASSGGTVVEPCGDTEVVQLCDLTYDPQAPIPTPAGDFTLSGNVVAANGGTTLWFAQANQPATGVAELTVSGLLPATLYQFRFASAWIGAGGADPAGNAAIYRLDVLDGATVLATRTRNVSNGSAVFPGGVLSEDLPPLPFIAPSSGAVTIRFTDQTTGGPFNDRDLFLMPLEVRTAVLTVTSTPFLRRFTFDCAGELISSQDLDLDGSTPYEVAGEVGQCAAGGDGSSSVTVPPCDANTVIQACRCDDTDGDGVADTDYVELLGVDCEGALTSLGTYTPDLTAPYTPVAPIACDETDEGAEPTFGVQARRVELSAGQSWDAAAWPTLQSVTAIAHGATGTVTTADGASTLHIGEAATWSVARDADASLTGPLAISAGTGTVTLSYTIGVTL